MQYPEGKRHPIYDQLTVFEDGRITNTSTKINYSYRLQHSSYYIRVRINGKVYILNAAKCIFETFKGQLDSNKNIYFVDGDRKNLRLQNLLALTDTENYDRLFQKLQTEHKCARHIKFDHMVALTDGRVFSLKRDVFIDGHKTGKGYITLNGIDLHKLVYECFHGVVDSKKYHIDHINNVHDDNRLANLQTLSHAEHGLKTRRDRPDASKKTGRSLSKPLIRFKLDDEGDMIDRVEFESVHEAIEETEKEYTAIKCTMNGLIPRVDSKATYKGFFWKSLPQNDLPGEEWRQINLPGLDHVKASTKGRIEFPNGRRTFGTTTGKYREIGHAKKHYPVHFLVCVTFHRLKHPSFIGDIKISVDHINHEESDNRPENLRWASKREQSSNKRGSFKIIAITKSTSQLLKEFNSTRAVAEYFQVSQDLVTRVLSGSIKNSKYFPDIVFKRAELTIEEPVSDAISSNDKSGPCMKQKNQHSRRRISAIQTSTGANIKDFKTVNEIATYFDISFSFASCLVSGTNKVRTIPDVRFQIDYIDE